MKTGRLLFYIFLLVISSSTIAQQNHFIYIQSEDKQPFYVLLNGKNHSSSPHGYITLPGLSGTGYILSIGFAKNKYPEQKFAINLQNDEGFSLKQAEDKSWSLQSMESQAIIVANQSLTVPDIVTAHPSNITNTPKDTPQVINTTVIAPVKEKEDTTTAIVQSQPASVIVKMLDKQGKEGIDQVYTDQFSGKTDTIAIFIPAAFRESKAAPADTNAMHCTLASEEDFRKLRAQMAAATDETGMIDAATTTFKEKCFSAEQVKNLSVLFLEEQHRYDFFVAAKPFIYDAQNFLNLQSQLSSPELIQQFKKLAQ